MAHERINALFASMFLDEEIDKNMQLSRTKGSYLVCCGGSPDYEHKLADGVQFARRVTVSFDEVYNTIAYRCQMDMAVRLRDVKIIEVPTKYWNSIFLGHDTSPDLHKGFENCPGIPQKGKEESSEKNS